MRNRGLQAPRDLAVRNVADAAGAEAPLQAAMGERQKGRQERFVWPDGPTVHFDPAYVQRGLQLFFERRGATTPEGLSDPVALAAARDTASGRPLRPLGAEPIAGGVRVYVALPVDPGPEWWGPRAGPEITVLSFGGAGEASPTSG